MRYTVQNAHGGRVAPARAVAHLQGLGQDSVGEKLAMSAPAIAGATLATASAMGAAWATAAIPVVGPIIAGVTIALMAIFARKGPKQKVATTEIVNKVEPLLQDNLAGYMAGPRTPESQAQALENFKAGWQWVVDNCDVPVMGNPGQECVNDRNRGGEWDWWSYYYDPIANDPVVRQSTIPGSGSAAGGGTVVGSGSPVSLPETVAGLPTGLLLAGVALVAALNMGGGQR